MRATSLFCCLIVCLPLTSQAMSLFQSPDQTEAAPEDARDAFNGGDRRLLGFNFKLLSIPGIAPADYDRLREDCGVRVLNGDDVVKDEQELDDLELRSRYAEAYNQAMQDLCDGDPTLP